MTITQFNRILTITKYPPSRLARVFWWWLRSGTDHAFLDYLPSVIHSMWEHGYLTQENFDATLSKRIKESMDGEHLEDVDGDSSRETCECIGHALARMLRGDPYKLVVDY
jgi:hypothetical protein